MTTPTDELLVEASRNGDRGAFATLVTRYRDLVVRVAYSRLGEFNSSEDIAQQTFVTAWNRKFDLADPSKIVAWLCGIARNLVLNERRKVVHESTETVDARMLVASTASPLQLSIEREEAELLWRMLQAIPETYREPMVLYYREQASTTDVANALDVTEDVVRQRLSRGRKLLDGKIAEYIEQTLSKRRTSQDFNSIVLAMLPASTALKSTSALVGVGAKSSFGFGAVLGPVLGMAGAVYGTKRSLDSASSATERRYIWKMVLTLTSLIVGLIGIQLALAIWLPNWNGKRTTQRLIWAIYAVLLSMTIARINQQHKRIKLKHGTDEEREALNRFDDCHVSPRSVAWNLVAGLTGCVSWMIVVAVLERDWTGLLFTIALLAGVLLAFLPKVRHADTWAARSRATWQAILAILAGTLAVVLVRWPVWSNQLLR